MATSITGTLLWAAALSSALMAGVYFAFSAFVMPALGRIDSVHAIATMNAINTTIVRSLFMPLFFGSSLISVLLMIVGVIHWNEPGAALTALAGAIYFFGMFVCTALFNVPLNHALANPAPDANAHAIWTHYLKTWTNWNHLRTVSALAACVIWLWLVK